MSIDAQRVQELFLAAVEQPSLAERSAFLDAECGGDDGLRQRVEALLRAHHEPGSFLEEPVAAATPLPRPPARESGDRAPDGGPPAHERIGPYKLLQKLGEGGMGEVWMADQEQPVKRRVALKVIRADLASRQVIARFEQERQALAMMDHPNIAKVLDAGEEPRSIAGRAPRPYFVMELVKGIPITTYCDQEHLSPKERLGLFLPVCHAVQHAHQKGIIHRDLKPSNVIVALYDGKPVPKVIDFGVAKATQQKLVESTVFTQVGQIVGTFEYMAPEQAELNNLDIDTRADIYSLGVLLYELLTGSPPFTKEQLCRSGYSEMLRIIREVEPVRPSTRLSSSTELPLLAAKRKLEPRRLTQAIHGDLDWIAMKCLEKERGRRYATANALALDIERYLRDEPVSAGPPGVRYRLGKFVRRNRVTVLAGALVVMTLVGGVIGTTVGLVRAERARHNAAEDRDKARIAEAAAVESEADTEAFSKFLVSDILEAARPEGWGGGLGVDVTVRKALDEAARDIGEQFQGRPRAEAIVRHDLGATYRMLGEYTIAESHLRRAVELRRQHLGPEHERTLQSEIQLAEALGGQGKEEEAVPLIAHALERHRAEAGPDSVEALNDMRALGKYYSALRRHGQAIALLEDALKRSRAAGGDRSDLTLSIMNVLGAAYRIADRPTDALPLHAEVYRIRTEMFGEDNPTTLMALHNLAGASKDAGQWSEAAVLFEKELKASKVKFGPDNRHTVIVMGNLIYVYQLAGRVPEAVALGTETLKLAEAKFGADDLLTVGCRHNLGVALTAARRAAEAIPLLEEALKVKKRKLSANNVDTMLTMDALASAYRGAGQLKAAIALFEEELALARETLSADDSHLLTCVNNMALAYQDAGRLPEAIALYQENLKLRKARTGPENPSTATAMHNLAWGYQAANRLSEAAPLYEQAHQIRKAKLGANHGETLTTLYNLANVYRAQEDFPRAEAAYLELLAEQRKAGANNPYIPGTLGILARLYLVQERFAEAEPILRESLALTTKKSPGHWQVAFAQCLLGVSLAGQQKYAEAEPLLRKGYEDLKPHKASLSADARAYLPKVVEKLVELYGASGRPADAEKWKKELAPSRRATDGS